MSQTMKRRPYVESMTNPSLISSGAQATEAIKLVHNGGSPILVRGFSLSYNGSAQAAVKVAIKDNANDVYIVTENTIISNIGYDRTSFAARFIRPVDPMILVSSGNNWTVIVWTPVNIAADDLCLTWDGVIDY